MPNLYLYKQYVHSSLLLDWRIYSPPPPQHFFPLIGRDSAEQQRKALSHQSCQGCAFRFGPSVGVEGYRTGEWPRSFHRWLHIHARADWVLPDPIFGDRPGRPRSFGVSSSCYYIEGKKIKLNWMIFYWFLYLTSEPHSLVGICEVTLSGWHRMYICWSWLTEGFQDYKWVLLYIFSNLVNSFLRRYYHSSWTGQGYCRVLSPREAKISYNSLSPPPPFFLVISSTLYLP